MNHIVTRVQCIYIWSAPNTGRASWGKGSIWYPLLSMRDLCRICEKLVQGTSSGRLRNVCYSDLSSLNFFTFPIVQAEWPHILVHEYMHHTCSHAKYIKPRLEVSKSFRLRCITINSTICHSSLDAYLRNRMVTQPCPRSLYTNT